LENPSLGAGLGSEEGGERLGTRKEKPIKKEIISLGQMRKDNEKYCGGDKKEVSGGGDQSIGKPTLGRNPGGNFSHRNPQKLRGYIQKLLTKKRDSNSFIKLSNSIARPRNG